MIYNGGLGETLEVRDDGVVITPTGVLGFANRGLRNNKFIPYSSITAVQFKDATLTAGYIQFTVPGGIENIQGLSGTWTDENTVNFTAPYNETFRAIRDYIQARIGTKANVPDPAEISAAAADRAAEGLTRFADLRDRGVITQEEFEAQKRALLAPRLPEPPLPQPPIVVQPMPARRPMPRWAKWAIAGCLLWGLISFVIFAPKVAKDAAADASKNAQAAASMDGALEIESTKLAADYSSNPQQAERDYGFRSMLVSGRVEGILREGSQIGSVVLRGGGRYPTVRAYLVVDDHRTMQLHQPVTLACHNTSNSSGQLTLADCSPN